MAKEIELGLVLDDKDSHRFNQYIEHPIYSIDTIELMRKAIEASHEQNPR